jgi:hypothetical protein
VNPAGNRAAEKCVALVAVLWVVALLSTLAAIFYTGLRQINPLSASREVRVAAALSAAQSDSEFKGRQAKPIGAASPGMDLAPGVPGADPPPAVTIRAEARTPAGGLFNAKPSFS